MGTSPTATSATGRKSCRTGGWKSSALTCSPASLATKLHDAAHRFLATVSQYGFLVSCESRISLTNSGPYRIDDRHEMIVRDFMDLAECSLPWLDGVAAKVPYNNLTVPNDGARLPLLADRRLGQF